MLTQITFNSVTHRYNSEKGEPIYALKDVNFTLHKNEFVSVLGPSGCGKSTLLRLLSGLMQPSNGHVDIYGKPITEPRSDVGIVFQKPTLLPWLNVRDNVLFPVKHKYGRITAKEKAYADELIETVGLSDFKTRRPDTLSGGMQQRVGIARALLLDPDILIMDEPFSALDALTREAIGFDLLKIWNERPKTVLFITHSISEAVLLSDRVLVMSPRPGTIIDTVQIELPRPRTANSIQHPLFNQYTQELRDHIYQQPQNGITASEVA